MRRILLPLLLLAACTARSQGIYSIVHNYFRQDPFQKPFGQFLNNLINDPALADKDIRKKTDSTLFFLQGTYPAHRPFFFPAQKCRVVLSEQQEFTDSSETDAYSFFAYQIIGYAAPGEEGIKDVRDEWERLTKKNKKGLTEKKRRELKRGTVVSGMIIDYTFESMVMDPLSLAWASSVGAQENIFVITVRFVLKDNQAFLPVPADRP